MTVRAEDIAVELGRPAPTAGSPTWDQWDSWIQRAYRTIRNRARNLGVAYESLDPETVDDVVIYAVARRTARPVDGAESTTDQVAVDDGSVNRTRRYGAGMGDIYFLDKWWALLGLAMPEDEWSGSISYGGR